LTPHHASVAGRRRSLLLAVWLLRLLSPLLSVELILMPPRLVRAIPVGERSSRRSRLSYYLKSVAGPCCGGADAPGMEA
jgi:hypothetical protein